MPHTAMCEDWEPGVLFSTEVERLGSEEAAAQSRLLFLTQAKRSSDDGQLADGENS
jgi:hypothetical protein